MDNLNLYNKVRAVPPEAMKQITAGRLKGMTDINPMWRIKTLTEQFGICGFGWKTEIVKEWLDEGSNGEITANVKILLFVKVGEKWSDGIVGVGGSKLVSSEKNGLYTDDECYKKSYTDALSVACKALGIGANVYWNKDTTKYETSLKQTVKGGSGNVDDSGTDNATKNEKKCAYCGEKAKFRGGDDYFCSNECFNIFYSEA